MPLVGRDLAKAIATEMGQDSTPKQLVAWADAVILEITTATATKNNFPGPHPISGLVPQRLADNIARGADYPKVTKELLDYCTAITDYITAFATVTYKSPPPPPPPGKAPDWFVDGTISGMVGNDLANLIAITVGFPKTSKEIKQKSKAIVNYIQTNATVLDGIIS